MDNGAHFDGDQSGTVNGVTPPAVQHLTAEVTADSGEYQVLARWDTPKVVKGVSFMLRLTVAADDGSERLVSTARTAETTYRFTQLALGNYRLTVRAVNAWGQQGDPASVSFRIAAPAAPSQIELTPGYFQITATPHLAVYDPTVQFEFWFSEKRIADIRQVETSARYLGTGMYWIAASINIKPGHDYYFYIRSVNTVGKSAFVEAVGQASDDAEGYLDFFKGQISGAPAWASEHQSTLSAGYLHARTNVPGSDDLNGINVKYRYEFTDTLGLVTSFSYAGDKNRQLTHYSDTRWHEDSVRNRWFSVMAGPSVRVNEWFSAYAMAGVAYSRVSTFSGDYLRVTDNKGKTHDVLTGSDDGRHSNTSLAWGAGVQFNPTESVAIDIAYEGSGSGDWRTDGFIVGVGYKF